MHLIESAIQDDLLKQEIVLFVNHGGLLVDIVFDILEVLCHSLVLLLLGSFEVFIHIQIDVVHILRRQRSG